MPQIDKKKNTDSDATDKDAVVSRDAYSGVDKQVLSELMKKNILSDIEATFKDKAAAFIKQHCYISSDGKLIIRALSKEFRDAIIGMQVNDISFGSFKYVMLNKFVVVKIANYGVVYDAINTATAKPSDYVVKKQKNGSFRLQNVNRATMEFEIQ